MLDSYFTTYEDDFQRHLRKIDSESLVDIKLTASSFTDCDGDHRVEYGFLVIYKTTETGNA